MQPNDRPGTRRVHGAEFKAAVLAQCRQPGASVAAVAVANGLNPNLVRKWLVGRGLKRSGLHAPDAAAAPAVSQAVSGAGDAPAPAAAAMRFVPVRLAAVGGEVDPKAAAVGGPASAAEAPPQLHVELRRGDASLAVRWPASHARECAAWLSELAGALLGPVSRR